MKKKPKISTLKKKAWKLCSEYIRRKYADQYGMVECVSCAPPKTRKHWKEMQAGHFVPRGRGNACYFLEENIHPQCFKCNINLGGNPAGYAKYIVEMYGVEKINELELEARKTVKFSVKDLELMIEDFKDKLNEIK